MADHRGMFQEYADGLEFGFYVALGAVALFNLYMKYSDSIDTNFSSTSPDYVMGADIREGNVVKPDSSLESRVKQTYTSNKEQ